ncbi:hypothetical protein GCM10022240_24090 [Microbacterium kribbense]|uniref:HNH endonuclease n=1 Tax=Microbacterium kribbense TaxID=433645 RepID=A0ABP7GS96_9MICO
MLDAQTSDMRGLSIQPRLRPGATVQVALPAATLAGQATGGGIITGYGATDDATARCLAGAAPSWVRVFTDPCTGVPISVDRYRPSKRGCRRPAHKCDIDHTLAHADGGPTGLCNLAHLCKRHPPHAYSTHRCALRGASRRVGPPSNTTPTGPCSNCPAASCAGSHPPVAAT